MLIVFLAVLAWWLAVPPTPVPLTVGTAAPSCVPPGPTHGGAMGA